MSLHFLGMQPFTDIFKKGLECSVECSEKVFTWLFRMAQSGSDRFDPL